MSIIYRGILTPFEICSPFDPAIDEKWASTPDEYLTELLKCDHDVPLPPAKAGERLTVLVFAPLDYAAYERGQYLIARAQQEPWSMDPEIQRHILRHAIADIRGAIVETEGEQRTVRARTEDGPYGRRLTAEAWEEIAPFAGAADWGIYALICLLRTQKQRGVCPR